jgi:hypothetical protein
MCAWATTERNGRGSDSLAGGLVRPPIRSSAESFPHTAWRQLVANGVPGGLALLLKVSWCHHRHNFSLAREEKQPPSVARNLLCGQLFAGLGNKRCKHDRRQEGRHCAWDRRRLDLLLDRLARSSPFFPALLIFLFLPLPQQNGEHAHSAQSNKHATPAQTHRQICSYVDGRFGGYATARGVARRCVGGVGPGEDVCVCVCVCVCARAREEGRNPKRLE